MLVLSISMKACAWTVRYFTDPASRVMADIVTLQNKVSSMTYNRSTTAAWTTRTLTPELMARLPSERALKPGR